jgi:D-erythrulose 4-phosphate isomerase
MKVVLGADSVGKPLLDVIAAHLARRPDLNVTDLSEPGLYADVAAKVAHALLAGEHERGILFCGTGIGVCISANKVAGIRAALTHETYSAERAAKSNNAQIITMGARVIGSELAKAMQGMSRDTLRRFADWLPNGQIDQKRLDALEMLAAMTEHITHGVSPLKVTYQMAHTFAWEYARQRSENNLSAP